MNRKFIFHVLRILCLTVFIVSAIVVTPPVQGSAVLIGSEQNNTPEPFLSEAEATVAGSPGFVVNLTLNYVWGCNWPSETNITLNIDATDVSTEKSGLNGCVGFFQFDIQPGQIVTVRDASITRTLLVKNLSVTSVSVVLDSVQGKADAGSMVEAHLSGLTLNTITDINGNWIADFKGKGDIVPGSREFIQIWSDGGAGTEVVWEVPGLAISGRIIDAGGNPLSGVNLSNGSGKTTTTNSYGYYTLTGLSKGSSLLQPSKTGFFFSPPSRVVTIDQTPIFGQDFTGTNLDCSSATASQPILLVTGWDGSVNKTLSEDENMSYLFSYLESKHYKEGCNLFYVENTSPEKWLDENAQIIRNKLCVSSRIVQNLYPKWTGSFDIIGYSYGGLRARAYLEDSKLYGKCNESDQKSVVRNLITLGTPHDGDMPNLPLSLLIGIAATADHSHNIPALIEMIPSVRWNYNLLHQQLKNINYYFISGDSRSQFVPLWLQWINVFKEYTNTASDMAVHQSSGFSMDLLSLENSYPRVTRISTTDVHGRSGLVPGLNDMTSYVDSHTTFYDIIWKIITGTYSGESAMSSVSPENITGEDGATLDSISQLAVPTSTTDLPQIDISAGVLSGSQTVTGSFEITNTGETSILLVWDTGDLSLEIRDPTGTLISQDNNHSSFDGGFGWITRYTLPNPQIGTWSYSISSQNLISPAIYRLVALPSTPITIVGSLPPWSPNNTPVIITAAVAYNGATPITGGAVIAKIQRPDSTLETIVLNDDGNHQDGSANDGVFGVSYTNTSLGGVYGILFTATGSYNSETFTRTATANFTIAPSSAGLGTQFADQGVDSNSDGFYEWLQITIPLTVAQAGKYSTSGDLYAGTEFLSHMYTETDLGSGGQTIALRFAGKDIYEKNLDGPYTLRNLLLFDANYNTVLIQAVDNAYSTGVYQYSQFESYATISGNAGVAGATVSFTGGTSVTSDETGAYSVTVPTNWIGTVIPSKPGYAFTPASRYYVEIQTDFQDQDFAASTVVSFVDVPSNIWFWKWVEGFYAKGITTGCAGPFYYCPDRAVTRAEMAVFLLRAQNVDTPGYTPSPTTTGVFSDVPVAGKEWMQPWIEEFYEQGITTGCGASPLSYCPERQVTRAEMAVFVLRSLYGKDYVPPAATGIFSDVPVTDKEWMQPWIEQYYKEGITTGCQAAGQLLRYCPEQSVTRAEMAVFIDRAFGFPQLP